jgi:DNA-binding response OmpR family regulator
MDATVNRIERLSVLDRAVTQVNTRNESLSTVADPRWDPIILDLGPRPSRDLALIQSIRRHSHAPPLLLSGQNGVNPEGRGTRSRGRPPVSRPFAIEEVLGRLRATARRGGRARSTAVNHHQRCADPPGGEDAARRAQEHTDASHLLSLRAVNGTTNQPQSREILQCHYALHLSSAASSPS